MARWTRWHATGLVWAIALTGSIRAQDESPGLFGPGFERPDDVEATIETRRWTLQQDLLGDPQWLAEPRIELFGWISQGFTYNPDRPRNRSNGFALFNDRANEYQLNQLGLVVQRSLDREAEQLDVGGRVDFLFGTDARFTQARGLELENDGTDKWNSEDHRFYKFSLPQLYAEFLIPVGNGVGIKVGKFYSPIGYERVPAPENFFYSHANLFVIQPRTHSGVLVTYPVNDALTLHAGGVNGVERWFGDEELGFLGAADWKLTDQTRVSASVLYYEADAPPLFGETIGDRVYVNAYVVHHLDDRTRIVLEGVFEYFENSFIVSPPPRLENGETYGVIGRVFHALTDDLELGFRAEWLRDDGPFTDQPNFFGFVFGANWQFHPNAELRPEVRVDLADPGSVLGPFDDVSDDTQVLLAVDLVVTF